MSTLSQLEAAVLAGDEQAAPRLIEQGLAGGLSAKQLLDEGLIAGMSEVGRRFRDGEYYLPEVLVAADALKAALARLQPHLVAQGVRPEATAVIGTVRGDLHDIGKNLAATMLQGAGFEVVDLGVDVPAEKFVAACQQQPVQVIGLSALLTTTMPAMEMIVQAVRTSVRPAPYIIVGGAPLTQAFADRIGADGYGRDAATGADLARRWCARR
ncbi:MAG TPA: cobalamin-dependent protein [Phycisphaerae bacterium]|nr:cobalamin-dependent protein [Phycisphaerae bacterium]HNU44168.1 cobalamin-dependent protein [Phycisphaerae bacterium]